MSVPIDHRHIGWKSVGAELAPLCADDPRELTGDCPDETDELLPLREERRRVSDAAQQRVRRLFVLASPGHAQRHLTREHPNREQRHRSGNVGLLGDAEPFVGLGVEIDERQDCAERGTNQRHSDPGRSGSGGDGNQRQRHDDVTVGGPERHPEDCDPYRCGAASSKRSAYRESPAQDGCAGSTASPTTIHPQPEPHATSIRTCLLPEPHHLSGSHGAREPAAWRPGASQVARQLGPEGPGRPPRRDHMGSAAVSPAQAPSRTARTSSPQRSNLTGPIPEQSASSARVRGARLAMPASSRSLKTM